MLPLPLKMEDHIYNMYKKTLCAGLLVCLLWLPGGLYGQSVQRPESCADSVRISLLTCSPSQPIYTLFGHTALRYEEPALGRDYVFNYGMFSFRAPNFILRFVKGETDYLLGVETYDEFREEYEERGSTVYEQELMLTADEKQRLVRRLEWNSRLENRTYRYNFFYDNCTTRARDQVERCLAGTVDYRTCTPRLSFRRVVHQHTQHHEWAQFGMDFCLGSRADEFIDGRTQQFAPFRLLQSVDSAWVLREDGTCRPLAAPASVLIEGRQRTDGDEPWCPTPTQSAWLLFAGVLLLTTCGFRRGWRLAWLDVLLYAVAGAAGCVVAFLVGWSSHPAVSPNYLLWAFHPLHLLYVPYGIYAAVKGRTDVYLLANAGVLGLFFVAAPFLPQVFQPAVYPLAGALWLRSLNSLMGWWKRKR